MTQKKEEIDVNEIFSVHYPWKDREIIWESLKLEQWKILYMSYVIKFFIYLKE